MSIESVMPSNHSGYPGSIPGQKSRSTPHTTAHYCLAVDQNQSILKELNSEYSLEGLLLKLKLQYFGHRMRKAQLALEKILMLGKTESKRRREPQRMRWLQDITDSMETSLSKLQEIVGDRGAWRVAVHGLTKSQTRLCH